jgi:hypothetical protein
MKIKTADLKGIALDWAIAQCDPFCEGLKFGIREGVMCGYGEGVGVCVFIVGPSFSKQMQARKKFPHASVYCPTFDWAQAGPFVKQISTLTQRDGIWRAQCKDRSGLSLEGKGETDQLAILRAVAIAHHGYEVDVPDEFLNSEKFNALLRAKAIKGEA